MSKLPKRQIDTAWETLFEKHNILRSVEEHGFFGKDPNLSTNQK